MVASTFRTVCQALASRLEERIGPRSITLHVAEMSTSAWDRSLKSS